MVRFKERKIHVQRQVKKGCKNILKKYNKEGGLAKKS